VDAHVYVSQYARHGNKRRYRFFSELRITNIYIRFSCRPTILSFYQKFNYGFGMPVGSQASVEDVKTLSQYAIPISGCIAIYLYS